MATFQHATLTKQELPEAELVPIADYASHADYEDQMPVRSPRVLPAAGIDDKSVVKAIVVASVIWSVVTIGALVSLYKLYRLWVGKLKRAS